MVTSMTTRGSAALMGRSSFDHKFRFLLLECLDSPFGFTKSAVCLVDESSWIDFLRDAAAFIE